MNIRPVTENDYPEIFRWFESRKWPLPPVHDIAPDFGMVAEFGGKLYACAFTYLTGRSIAFLEWTGTNPDIPEGEGALALVKIVQALKESTRHMTPPVKALCLYTQNDKLAEQFERLKFRKQTKYHRLLWTDKH